MAIAKKCYVVEVLEYIAKKHDVIPRILRMYEANENYFTIPYYVAAEHGFKPIGINGNKFPWYCIQPLIINNNKNIWETDKNSPYYRPFIGGFRDYQGEVIKELLEQIEKYCTTTLGLPPGWGKTMATIYITWCLGLRACAILPIIILIDSWEESIKKFLPHFKIWIVGKGECPPDVDIILCMDGRFKYIPKDIVNTIGTLIVDEVHTLCTETVLDVYLNIFPKYILLLSATFKKEKGFRKIGKLMAGEHGVFRVSKVPYNIFIVETGIMGEEEHQKNGDLISTKLRANLALNEFRQNLICMIIMQNCNHHKFMTRRSVKAGIPQLVQKINNCGITADSMFGHKSSYENSMVLCGTWQKMGFGFDEAMACKTFWMNPRKSDTMIFEDPTADEEIYEQNRCRIRFVEGDMPSSIIFLQDMNKSYKRQIDALKPWFRETNGTVYYVKAHELILPRREQIFQRQLRTEIFYRVCNDDEYNLFKEYHILDDNPYDKQLGGMEVFTSSENLLAKYNIPGLIVITLTNITVATNGIQYISTCPICTFQVINVSKI